MKAKLQIGLEQETIYNILIKKLDKIEREIKEIKKELILNKLLNKIKEK